MNMFVDMLSPSLKTLVMRHIFINTFNENPVFSGETELIDFYIKDIVPYMRQPDDVIMEQGNYPNNFYFIAQGQCQVKIINHNAQTICVPHLLEKDEYFGEIAILFDCKRTATIVSTNYCSFARISREHFL